MAAAQAVSPNTPRDAAVQSRLDLATQFLRAPALLRDSRVSPQWLGKDEQLIVWDEIGPDAGAWVLFDAAAGRRSAILAPAELRRQLGVLAGETVAALSQMQFLVAPDQRAILFTYKDRSFRLDVIEKRLSPAGSLDSLALTGASVSADGRWAGMARDGGFEIRDAADRTIVQRAGETDYAWAIPDKAWSPDSGLLAVWRSDQRSVHDIPIVNYAAAAETVAMIPYAKTGTPLARSELYLADPQAGTLIAVAPAPEEGYDWFAGWRRDGQSAFVLHLSRDGKRLDLSAIDRAGGRKLLLREERLETNVGDLDFIVNDWPLQVTPLEDGGFLWMSERDGWRHVYRYDREGRLMGQVTHGGFPVHRVDHVGCDGDMVITAAIDPAKPYDEQIYRTDLNGAPLQALGHGGGFHRVIVAPSGRFLVDSWSSPVRSRVRDVVSADGRGRVRLTTSDDAALTAVGWQPREMVSVMAADRTTPIYGAIFKPRDFDPAKHYPVLAYIYGAPFVRGLDGDYFGGMSLSGYSLAQMGFIVAVFDVRGTTGRSKAFQDATYGKIGETEVPDYVAGLRQVAASRPWMDMDRVGIVGHSWGGYFALRGMLTAPEMFKAGYAGAPGALEEAAEINEPNMGLIADNPAGYAAGSNLPLAAKLQGHLKIMHGTSDVSASLSSTMRMVDALIKADKRFELLIIPGMDHNSSGQDGLYYDQDIGLFFLRTLGDPR